MPENALSASLEDYLEAIYLLTNDKFFVHAGKIAEHLGVGKSSVSWALNQLSQKELINYARYEVITLTEKGKILAQQVSRRHHGIRSFLTDILALDEQLAEDNACRMEHVMDPKVLQRMQQFMTFLCACPRTGSQWLQEFGRLCQQGKLQDHCPQCVSQCLEDLIHDRPSLDSTASETPVKSCSTEKCPHGNSSTLSDLPPGGHATILGIRGRSSFKKRLLEMGLVKGETIRKVKLAPLADPAEYVIKNYHVSLRREEAADVMIELSAEPR
jgi:DtxR family transcriptional regulator, Mn-dependent transcriptional regulator